MCLGCLVLQALCSVAVQTAISPRQLPGTLNQVDCYPHRLEVSKMCTMQGTTIHARAVSRPSAATNGRWSCPHFHSNLAAGHSTADKVVAPVRPTVRKQPFAQPIRDREVELHRGKFALE